MSGGLQNKLRFVSQRIGISITFSSIKNNGASPAVLGEGKEKVRGGGGGNSGVAGWIRRHRRWDRRGHRRRVCEQLITADNAATATYH